MSNIGTIIGWKFNHQPGMSTRDGVITEFPGGIPSQADQDTWTAEYLVEFPEGYGFPTSAAFVNQSSSTYNAFSY